jgi:dethiobiotin synthetase
MSAVFVTATGTDIGKTFVSCGLIRHARAIGRPVDAIKPVATGFDERDPQGSDAGMLLTALARAVTSEELERVCPWRFSAPISPHLAAAHEQRPIDFARLVQFCRTAVSRTRGLLLIEGIGGIMVPLDDRRTVLDLISLLRIPVLLVTGSYVGTLSHTFTALEVLARRNIDIAVIAVDETPGSAASLEDTAKTLAHFAAPLDVVPLPRLPADAPDHPAFAQILSLLSA